MGHSREIGNISSRNYCGYVDTLQMMILMLQMMILMHQMMILMQQMMILMLLTYKY